MKKQHIPTIIFFGSLWGIIEATLGYILHFLPVYIAGTILFPVVGYILYKAYEHTKSRVSLLAIGAIAASIKAVDFFMPFGSPFKIINPMISIIMESIMVLTIIHLLQKDDIKSKISGFVIASIGWRLLYVAYNFGQFLVNGYVSTYLESFYNAFEYTVIFGLISAGIALAIHFLGLYIVKHIKGANSIRFNPIISFASLVIAIILTILM